MDPKDAAYSERYCAFIDILGFRGLIDDLEKGRISLGDVYRALSAVHSPKPALRRIEADLKYQRISDAIAISAAPNAPGLDALCTAAEELSRMLLRSGYFARGGITKGRLYHDQNMVFGPAQVEAYRLESEVAKYPRILIPRSVATEGLNYSKDATHWKDVFEGRFLQARDGPFFLHVLRDLSRKAEALATRKPRASAEEDAELILAKQMRNAIQKRFDEASDNPDHFQKIDWFVHYWNSQMGHGIQGLEEIRPQPL